MSGEAQRHVRAIIRVTVLEQTAAAASTVQSNALVQKYKPAPPVPGTAERIVLHHQMEQPHAPVMGFAAIHAIPVTPITARSAAKM